MFKSEAMEPAVDLLMKNFHRVLVIGAWWCHPRIRMRADLIKDKRIWWWKTQFQRDQWQKEGGAMLTFNKMLEEGEHDAVFFIECPRTQHLLDRACQRTRTAGCVFVPPTWRVHEETIERRFAAKPEAVLVAARDDLTRMRALVDTFPTLTQKAIDRLRLSLESSLSSSAPAPRAAAALPFGTSRSIP